MSDRLLACHPWTQHGHTQKKIYLFIAMLGSSLLHGLFFSCCERGLLCSYDAWASHASGLSRCEAQVLGYMGFSSFRLYSMGSIVVMPRLSRMWDLPRPGIKPVSPALAGGFFTA